MPGWTVAGESDVYGLHGMWADDWAPKAMPKKYGTNC